MRRRDLAIGRLRAVAAQCRQLAEHYEHRGPVLLSDGTRTIRQRTAEDVLRARILFDEWNTYTLQARDLSEGAA